MAEKNPQWRERRGVGKTLSSKKFRAIADAPEAATKVLVGMDCARPRECERLNQRAANSLGTADSITESLAETLQLLAQGRTLQVLRDVGALLDRRRARHRVIQIASQSFSVPCCTSWEFPTYTAQQHPGIFPRVEDTLPDNESGCMAGVSRAPSRGSKRSFSARRRAKYAISRCPPALQHFGNLFVASSLPVAEDHGAAKHFGISCKRVLHRVLEFMSYEEVAEVLECSVAP